VSAEKDILQKAKEEMRLSERILAAVPGFRGYKEKELRRESDRLVRDHLYRRLSETEDGVKSIFQELSDKRAYGSLESMDRLVMRFDRLRARIRRSSYGYSGFFDVVKIEEDDLDRMMKFDESLLTSIEELSQVVKEKKGKVGDDVTEWAEGLNGRLSSLDDTFSERREIILGVK